MIKFTGNDRLIIEGVIGAVTTNDRDKQIAIAVRNLLDAYDHIKNTWVPLTEGTNMQVSSDQLPIDWDTVLSNTDNAVKHYFVPNTNSSAVVCDVCNRSEWDSIHITRKEYQR